MHTTINWAKLLKQNRVKEIGIPWSPEEREAIKDGISPDDVRAGILNEKDVKSADKKEKKSGKKSLFRMTKPELIVIAKKEGLAFNEKDTPRATLMSEIAKKRKKKTVKK